MITNKQTLEDIIAARALIADPDSWTQNAFARDKQGKMVEVDDPVACSFCADAAIQRAIGTSASKNFRADNDRWGRAYVELSADTSHGLINFNDDEGRTHAELLAQFDITITRLLAA